MNKNRKIRKPVITRRIYQVVFFFVFFCLTVLFLKGCAPKETVNISSEGKEIVCFGDSITMGYGVNKGEDYPSYLRKMVNLPVINAGVNGDTSTEALKRFQKEVLDRKPLLVIIEFGGNDFVSKVPLKETIKNVEEMIKKAQVAGAMVAIADVGTYIIMSDYSREFKILSDKYNTILLPNLLNGIFTNPSLKSDFIHPNAKGYQIVSHRVYRGISPYLNQNAMIRSLQKNKKSIPQGVF